jgi:nicotinate phosphoribosyltransferase
MPPDSASSAATFSLTNESLCLATDLYQLTMAAAYYSQRPQPQGSFELFVRRLPPHRNFLLFAGLQQALASLTVLRFAAEEIDYLKSLSQFKQIDSGFFQFLEEFRFTGDVYAIPEGTVFFPDEPVMRVSGTLLEAQLIETLLLSIINFQTAICSKAARIRLAAGKDHSLAEFGSRRAHGPQAASWVARAAYLAGFDATSNLFAGKAMDIPVVGTMAHSFVMSFDSEREAFEEYVQLFPDNATLLVDTYDSLQGVRTAIDLGCPIAGVRLDSGNLGELARAARDLLDRHGHSKAKILVSGDLNETKIGLLLADGAPIDSFGVGTQLAACADAPVVGGIYKLVEVLKGMKSIPKFKDSTGKSTYPGRKQVVRRISGGRMSGDLIVPADRSARAIRSDRSNALNSASEESELLQPVVKGGEILPQPTLADSRLYTKQQIAQLPVRLQQMDTEVTPYSVVIDPELEALFDRGRIQHHRL